MRIDSYKAVFWDFDGVIKDSVGVKTQAFMKLFEECGDEVARKIRDHHLENGGMSRFKKIPIYALWAGKEINEEQLKEYCRKFSSLVFQGVLQSDWVPGVEKYLRQNNHNQIFILVSAIPQHELDSILSSLNLHSCFMKVFGSPIRKGNAIAKSITYLRVSPGDCLMIGDARADMEAAQANGIDFLLRRHSCNQVVFCGYDGLSIDNLLDI